MFHSFLVLRQGLGSYCHFHFLLLLLLLLLLLFNFQIYFRFLTIFYQIIIQDLAWGKVVIIIITSLLWDFFTPALADVLSLKLEWQQASSSLQDSS